MEVKREWRPEDWSLGGSDEFVYNQPDGGQNKSTKGQAEKTQTHREREIDTQNLI